MERLSLIEGKKSKKRAEARSKVVIPQDVIPDFHTTIEKLLATEKLVLEPARAPGFDFETFEKAWAAFEAART